jgi:hypothetical protein
VAVAVKARVARRKVNARARGCFNQAGDRDGFIEVEKKDRGWFTEVRKRDRGCFR